MHDGHIIVVKLGGSLAGSAILLIGSAPWRAAVAGVSSCPAAAFADAVRQAQAKIGSAMPPLTTLLFSRWSNLDGRLQVSIPTFVSQIPQLQSRVRCEPEMCRFGRL
jgi:hypothetical protein